MRYLLYFFVFFSFAFASDAQTDIIPRTFNFAVSALILFFLLKDPVKAFFLKRKDAIAQLFESIQDKLKESEEKKAKIKKQLENSKTIASQIVRNSKEEAMLIVKKLAKQNEFNIKILQKQEQEAREIARNKMIRDVVKTNLSLLLKDEKLSADTDKILEIVTKRIAK